MTTLFSSLDPALSEAILQTVIYADIFDYPLTAAEIRRYLAGIRIPPEAAASLLDQSGLVPERLSRQGAFYTLPGREAIVELRMQRERMSVLRWTQARRFGRLIAGLPFVRMAAVTGSLAVNNPDENGDIDFLIVTTAGRLWVCRAIVILVVRLARLWKVTLCPNYLVSEEALVFNDRQLYTAHEIAQMAPLSGPAVYARLRQLNGWVDELLPNAEGTPPGVKTGPIDDRISRVKRLAEWLLLSPLGSFLEKWESSRKIRKLRRQAASHPEALFNADICKGHFNRHGQRLTENLDDRLRVISERTTL